MDFIFMLTRDDRTIDDAVTVLDEATASLDPLAEAALEASLRPATAGRTVIEIE